MKAVFEVFVLYGSRVTIENRDLA